MAGARRQVDPEVYLLDLKGRHLWNLRSEQGVRQGAVCFRQALDRDPTYAPAWVGLADCFNILVNYGLMAPVEGYPQALGAARRALELDEQLGDAHRALALVRWMCERDWRGAESAYLRVLELDPSSSLGRLWFGVCLAVQGRVAEGREQLMRAQELDPMSLVVRADIGWTYSFERRYAEAVPYFRRALEVDPEFFMAHWLLGVVLCELGELEEAVASTRRACELHGGSRFLAYHGYTLARAGRTAEAQGVLAALAARSERSYLSPYFPALVWSGLGSAEETSTWLARCVESGDAMVRDLRVDPPFHRWHGEPFFVDVLRRLRLA